MFTFSTNKCYNQWFKSIEQILNILFKYKPKRDVGLLKCSKMTYFHLECQNPIKKSNNVLVFAPTSFIFSPKPLECKFVINKNNLIIFINAPFLWKKSNINSTKFGDLSCIKKLCHCIKHILFYLWLKYGAIWTIC